LVDSAPASELVRGALAYQTIALEDDYIASDAPASYVPLYTSLSGMNVGRDPMGATMVVGSGAQAVSVPVIEFKYPEASALPGRVLWGGRPYIEPIADGRLRVWPRPTPEVNNRRLKLDFGAGHAVRYHVKVFRSCDASACGCTRFTEDSLVTDAAGVDLE